MSLGGAGEQVERLVVVDCAVVEHHPTVAVRGVLAQAHVGHDDQIGMGVLQRSGGELDDALVVVGAGAELVLVRRDAEEQDAGHAEPQGLAGLLDRVRN
jgi:carbonic anhydrase/acetyltransferase-like protein (isoleucine patch superfamily)